MAISIQQHKDHGRDYSFLMLPFTGCRSTLANKKASWSMTARPETAP